MAKKGNSKEDASELARRLDVFIQQITDQDAEVEKSDEEWRQSQKDGLRILAKAVAFLLKREYERGKRTKDLNELSLLSDARDEVSALNSGHEPKNIVALPHSGSGERTSGGSDGRQSAVGQSG